MQEGCDVELIAMGAGANNQAVKSLIKARAFAAPIGWDLSFKAGFIDLEINGETKSAICYRIIKT